MSKSIGKPEDYFSPIPALIVDQGKYEFYIFSMNSKDLLSIAYTSRRNEDRKRGVQRGLDPKRLKEIGDYYQSKAGQGPGILPNPIIISLSKNSFFKNGQINIYRPKKDGEAFVIDGQHRLFAFEPEYANGVEMDLAVTAFIDLEDEMKAYIFRTINSKQRKINPSLVYDLIPMLRKDWICFEDDRAHFFLEYLTANIESPWYDGVDMLGGRSRPITQASFMTRLKTLFKKGNIFEDDKNNEFFEQSIQINLLVEYFQAIHEVFPRAWLNKKYILCKDVGTATMLNLLKPIVQDLAIKGKVLTDDKGLVLTKEDFIPYFRNIRSFSFSSEEYGADYLGLGGIRKLTQELQNQILR